MHCSACNSCHSNEQAGWCTNYHCGCAMDEEAQLTPDVLFQVVRSNQASDVVDLLTRYPGRVNYNASRGVLQLLGCDARVSAQVAWSPALATDE